MSSYLGQNFLKNKKKIENIANALDLKKGDVVIEIGPGHGELTNELRIKDHELRIIAIEKDEKLATELKRKFNDDKNIEIIEGDVLKILPELTEKLKGTKSYKIVGNIPYYITGFLFRILGELENKPESIVLMIQKEVAERVAAFPPKNNLLAASVGFWADVEIVDHVSKKDFNPVPKVDSAVIRLKIKNKKIENTEKYYEFIKILFKQPRKTVLNNLEESEKRKGRSKEEIVRKLEEAGINPQDRPQNLSLEQIIELSGNF